MGKDIGFLPGDINEKLTPWMQPLYIYFVIKEKIIFKNINSDEIQKM